MTSPIEEVVLVDEENNILGTMPKSLVHGEKTPLHRAFSAFIFNYDKKLLLQQRSHVKKTWPLAWSNSCCGHP
jgi:isopentenyl-diphosphate delta-isomerase